MGNRLPFASTPTTSSSSSHAEGQGQERHAASGRISSDGGRSSRPTASTKPVALQGNSCPKQGDEQQVRHLGQLPPVRVPSMVQASSWQPGQLHGDDEWHQREASFGRTTRSSTSSSNAYGRAGARDDREGGGRGAHQDHADGLREDHAEERGEDQQGQIGRDGRKGKRVCFSDPKTSNTNTRAWPFSCVKRMATGLSQQDGPQHGLRAPDSGGEGAPHAACGRTGSSAGDQCEHQLGHGAGACVRGATAVKDATFKMPLRVGKGVMMMAAALCDQLHSEIAQVVYQKPPMLWEMFCSPDSELTNQALKAGLCAYRINLAAALTSTARTPMMAYVNFDFATSPRSFGSALLAPSTVIGQTSTITTDVKFFERRRKEKSMHLKVMDFAEEALLEDETADLYWEWPRRCRAWKEPHVKSSRLDSSRSVAGISTCAKSMDAAMA